MYFEDFSSYLVVAEAKRGVVKKGWNYIWSLLDRYLHITRLTCAMVKGKEDDLVTWF